MKKLCLLVILMSISVTLVLAEGGNTTNDSFDKSKRLLSKIYLDLNLGDFYCGAHFDADNQITDFNGYVPRRDNARAHRIEWDHVVAAENFGQSFKEWRDGDPSCIDKKGQPLSNRDCTQKLNPEYRLMQADMYNLRPAVGEMNGLKSNYGFAMLTASDYNFGACQVKIADRKIEPPPNVRGDIARIFYYMDKVYPNRGIISNKNEKLFAVWNKEDPVDANECALYERIKKLQGNENPIMQTACASGVQSPHAVNTQPANIQPTPTPTPKPTLTPTPKKQEVQPKESKFSCNPKKNCGQMNSCDEAYFHLKECGNKSLDRDKDGIPCESLCE